MLQVLTPSLFPERLLRSMVLLGISALASLGGAALDWTGLDCVGILPFHSVNSTRSEIRRLASKSPYACNRTLHFAASFSRDHFSVCQGLFSEHFLLLRHRSVQTSHCEREIRLEPLP